jgi:glutamine amidotransferase-like uncharacterized protein
LLSLLLLVGRGTAADLAEDQEALVRALGQSAAAAEQNATPVRLALFDVDAGTGKPREGQQELKAILEAQSTIACQTVSGLDVQQGILKQFDVVLFPGGYAPTQYAVLDDDGRAAVKQFVRDGGGYVGICAGAFLASSKYGAGLDLIDVTPLGRRDENGKMIPSSGPHGSGKVKMELTGAGQKLFGGPAGEFEAMFSGGPVLSPAGTDLSAYVALGMIRGQATTYESQQGDMVDTPAIVAGRFGEGHVIVFSPHLEFSEGFESLVRRGILAARRFPPATPAEKTE